MLGHEFAQVQTDIQSIMGAFQLVELNIIGGLRRHIFRIAIFLKLIGLPGLRWRKINFTIKIFPMNPNKHFKTGVLPEKILTRMRRHQIGPLHILVRITQPVTNIQVKRALLLNRPDQGDGLKTAIKSTQFITCHKEKLFCQMRVTNQVR